jgi:hypothetical protein
MTVAPAPISRQSVRRLASDRDPARLGRISEQGPGRGAARSCRVSLALGTYDRPDAGLYPRIGARRGANIATVRGCAQLAVISWHMLTHEQDYTFARPSPTREKLRRLERSPVPNATVAAATPSVSSHRDTSRSSSAPPRPNPPTSG